MMIELYVTGLLKTWRAVELRAKWHVHLLPLFQALGYAAVSAGDVYQAMVTHPSFPHPSLMTSFKDQLGAAGFPGVSLISSTPETRAEEVSPRIMSSRLPDLTLWSAKPQMRAWFGVAHPQAIEKLTVNLNAVLPEYIRRFLPNASASIRTLRYPTDFDDSIVTSPVRRQFPVPFC